MKNCLSLLIATFIFISNSLSQVTLRINEDYITGRTVYNGKEVDIITVPGRPPEKHREPPAIPTRSAVMLDFVPAFDWSFGCSATSASMMAGYYDNNGYTDMYTGPTNWGFMPMDNSAWGYVTISGESRAQCPLSATRNGIDGRTTRGHVDDYWIAYGNEDDDPYITNSWTEHTYGECTGDYMKTNQSAYGNSDGSTTFYYYVDGSPTDLTEPADGCYGFKLFLESRGYTVLSYYSQYIDELPDVEYGFTFDQYKHEIDNGRPVMIQVEGHSMVGMGYDDASSTVYLHDTWDYTTHSMIWAGSYSGMDHYAVAVFQLEPPENDLVANFSVDTHRQLINTSVYLSDMTFGSPISWNWSIQPSTFSFAGGTSSSSQNPIIQFTEGGYYTVTLTVSDGTDQVTEVRTNYIEAVACDNYPLPLTEDFSERSLPMCWQIVDHIGNGQVWHFNNPANWEILTSTAGNGFVMIDSDHFGSSGSQNTDLVTPVLDFTGYTSVNLYFEHYFRQYLTSTGTLAYSINGGSTWTVLQTWSTDTDNPEIVNLNITTQVAGQANVRFKWNYTGAYDYYWALDDISITGVRPGLWTGTSSASWNASANWSGGSIPSNTTDVVIPFIAENWPVYTGNLVLGTHCRNITMEGASHLSVTGNLTVPSARQLSISSEGILNVGGAILK